MATWRFYQGLRGEWRWYQMDTAGKVISASDHAFAKLDACMANATERGFSGGSYQVHTRGSDTLEGSRSRDSGGGEPSEPSDPSPADCAPRAADSY